jgi:hypothetical protein
MSDSIDPKPPPSPQDDGVSAHAERDATLAAVLREQSEKQTVEVHARRARIQQRGLGSRHVALVFATAISVWIWVWPPSVLQITPAVLPSVEAEESALRLVMYFQAQKIERYRLDTGGVPLELDDAGPPFTGMEYIRLTNNDYRLLGRTRRVTLSYSSVEPLDVFVGAGAGVLGPLVFE